MFFATQGAYKSVRAAQTAALLGWSTVQHGDRLGGLVFSESDHLELRPRRGKQALLHMLQKIADNPAWIPNANAETKAGSLQQSLQRLQCVAQPGSLIFLISDFHDMDTQYASQLTYLSRHSDLVMVSVQDPLDKDLPPAGRYRFSDGQRFLTMDTEPQAVRKHYQQRYQSHQSELQGLCRRHGIYQISMDTVDDPLTILRQGLGGKR